jgi:hypothetical protein
LIRKLCDQNNFSTHYHVIWMVRTENCFDQQIGQGR